MKSFERYRIACAVAVSIPLLFGTTLAHGAQCRGSKVVQNCIMYHADGTWYASNPSVPAAYTSCQPIQVPCDYPDNIFDAISKVFGSER